MLLQDCCISSIEFIREKSFALNFLPFIYRLLGENRFLLSNLPPILPPEHIVKPSLQLKVGQITALTKEVCVFIDFFWCDVVTMSLSKGCDTITETRPLYVVI